MLRRHHYERAFEEYLRGRRIPYVAVDEARKTLVPGPVAGVDGAGVGVVGGRDGSLKSFDFVVYGEGGNLLIDIKGRRLGGVSEGRTGRRRPARMESWVTEEDVASMRSWGALFGEGFEAVFVFIYCCEEQPPDALFQEVFEYRGSWYVLRAASVAEYGRVMKPRSPRWRTVHVPAKTFERISRPLADWSCVRPIGAGRTPCEPGPEVPVLAPRVAGLT